MRVSVVASLAWLAVGCGGASQQRSAQVAHEEVAPQPADDAGDAVIVALGCDSVRRSEVDHAVAIALHRASAQATSAATQDREALRAEVIARIVRARIAAREAARLAIEVTEAQVDEAVRAVCERQELDEMELVVALGMQGMTLEEYRADLRVALIEAAVTHRLAVALPDERAVARRIAEQGRDAADPGDVEAARTELREQAVDAAWAERVARAQARLAGLTTHTEHGRCVEPALRVAPEHVRFEGAHAIAPDALRAVLAQVAGPGGKLDVGVLGELPQDAVTWIEAAYFEIGHAMVRTRGEPDGRGIVVWIDEGPVFRIGRVEVVIAPAGGGERRSPHLGAAPSTGELFVRSRLVRWRQELEETHRAAGLEVTSVEPLSTVDVARARIDLRMVVHVPGTL